MVTKFYRRNLPHLRIDGAVYFVTWRLRNGQADLSDDERDRTAAAIRHFARERYVLHGYVVMNDHVHVLVEPHTGRHLEEIVHSWKSFTANNMQRSGGRHGSVWQDEYFDRVVRDDAEYREKWGLHLAQSLQAMARDRARIAGHGDWGWIESVCLVGRASAPVMHCWRRSGRGGPLHCRSGRGGPLHCRSGRGGPLHCRSGRGGPLHCRSGRGGPLHCRSGRGGPLHCRSGRGGPLHCESRPDIVLTCRPHGIDTLRPGAYQTASKTRV